MERERRAERLYESRPDPQGKGLGTRGRLPSLATLAPEGVR